MGNIKLALAFTLGLSVLILLFLFGGGEAVQSAQHLLSTRVPAGLESPITPAELATPNATAPNAPVPDSNSNSGSNSISKDLWAAQIKTRFLAEFCQKPTGFAKCYEGSKTGCRAAVNDSLKDCLSEIGVPNAVEKGPESQALAHKLNHCLSEAVHAVARPKPTQAKYCQSPSL